MKNMFVAVLAGALVLGGSANAAKHSSKQHTAKAKVQTALICPVTGDKIASIAKAAGSSVYKGKTYYFCCGSCKPAFDKDPAKYIKTASKPADKTKKHAHSAA